MQDEESSGGSRFRPRVAATAVALQFRAAPVGAWALLVTTVAGGVAPAAVAWCGKLLFDEIGRGHDADPWRAGGLAAAMGMAGVVMAAMAQATGYLDDLVRQRLAVAVERRLFAKVNEFRGLRRFEDPAFHDRLRLATQASTDAPHNITGFCQQAVQALAQTGGFLGVLLAVWPPMAVLLLACGAASLVSRLALARRQIAVAESVSGRYRRQLFYRSLLTDPRAAKEIRLFGLGGFLHGRLVEAIGSASAAELAVKRRGALAQTGYAVLNAVVTGTGIVIVAVGAAHGRFSVGDVSLFVAATAGIQGAFTGVVVQAGMAAEAVRLFGHYTDLMELPDDLPAGSAPVPRSSGRVEFRDVWFRYDEDGPWILRGVDLVLPAGAAVGLVGRNGAGKSTLVKLLCRFYDPDRGAILWDGTDLRDLDVEELRARIGVTFQDYLTYDFTAQDNIGIGDLPHREDGDRVRAAARLAGIDDELAALPHGYRTQLSRVHLDDDQDGERGVTLSGGQWQRVALARSLMRSDASLLILDEPSSGLDAEAEHRVHRTLAEHRAGRTGLLISHRLGALREADTIAVLADGRIAETGTHDELMRRGGHYATLFTLQAAGYRDEPADLVETETIP
ncbi:ABC transporter ATP-binding protein [Actinomadura logoneensis]|uniref:ABC transporter ATP-binding protein n=1 Tax=Actinomadura logoneensis TaxID=2293572 RepID=A0A372JU18_9ACTN|nr:ABC transporter ATP-binding protein [Actinomadura logoneensis]